MQDDVVIPEVERLTHEELTGLVERIVDVLYWDAENDRMDPEKEWDHETLEDVRDVLKAFDIVPYHVDA